MYSIKQILITGAGGFVGKNLTKYLSGKYHIYPMSHRELDLLNGDAVKDFFVQNPVDVVLHCAAIGGSRLTNYDVNNYDVVEKNLRMFLNLQRALPLNSRIIHFGSGAEYSRTHYTSKMVESYFDVYVPADAYGFSKYAISRFIELQDRILCLRIFGLYGKYEDYRYKYISNTIVKGLLGIPITISQNVVFDYLYIEDFVRLVEKLLLCDWPYRHMNITPNESIDLLSLARLANGVTGNTTGIEVLNPGWNTEYTGDNTRLMEVVKPFIFTPYQKGIKEVTEYYRSVWDDLDIETVRDDPFLDKCIIRK